MRNGKPLLLAIALCTMTLVGCRSRVVTYVSAPPPPPVTIVNPAVTPSAPTTTVTTGVATQPLNSGQIVFLPPPPSTVIVQPMPPVVVQPYPFPFPFHHRHRHRRPPVIINIINTAPVTVASTAPQAPTTTQAAVVK